MSKAKSNPMKPLVLITVVIIILVSAIVVINSKQNQATDGKILVNHPSIENQPTIGDPNASVSVVEFADYKCPACKMWGEQIFPLLKKDFVDTGKITFSYVNVLFHGDESFLGSLAGEAVWNQDPEAFWEFNKALYQEQPSIQNHDDPWITVEKVMEVAKKAVPHLDLELLEQDIINMTYKDAVLLDDQLVEELDIPFTPSIIINGTFVEEPFDYELIKQLIEGGLGN
ncbi:DsbA family protein [Anaerobacillus sp. CMMVII]|uniref:DsbA family protein n=1 Tax=Anaerobacillus sp. CMMVII TaxID=2755588 RepID=UPI0021B70FE2|nr:DsbA family protein [Anaerobacillus sp. CMMVII]MCT8137721.1 DsbA family protein [Anaerobacillus sp. CMMVII]